MEYIEAPNEYTGKKDCIFLAGGISGCPDWQHELKELLKDEDIVLFNPRRDHFPKSLKGEEKQIAWEYKYLKKAKAISFWFPKETLCPITLFELGSHLTSNQEVFIGVHPDFARKIDVEMQTKLANPKIKIVYDIEALAKQIKDWLKSIQN